jgi:SNF2 family DNA or RNA helicase
LYSQCNFLNEELLDGGSYYAFRNRYAIMKNHNFGGRRVQLIVAYQKLDELASILKDFSYRVLKEECLDLPPKVYIKREIELSKDQLQAYSTMKSAALALLKGKMATAPHVLTQMMRLHQITCGHLKNDDGTITEIKNNRIKELLKVLEDTNGKVIIWANYIHDIENIVKAISTAKDEDQQLIYGSKSVVQYYGGTSTADRADAITKFQDLNSEVKFFVGNAQTAGYGITLTAASTVIYYSNGYDLEKRLQSEDRAHRIGQEKSVTYIDFIAPKTVDEKIVKALRNKINIASQVMGEELKSWI